MDEARGCTVDFATPDSEAWALMTHKAPRLLTSPASLLNLKVLEAGMFLCQAPVSLGAPSPSALSIWSRGGVYRGNSAAVYYGAQRKAHSPASCSGLEAAVPVTSRV